MALQLDGTLLLAGVGNMGHALLAGWLQGGLEPGRIVVQDPAPQPHIRQELEARGVPVHAEVAALPEPPAVLMLAVKPQVMDQVLPQLAKLVGRGTLVVSIAAGRQIAGLAAHLPEATAVVRAMPNTPASVGRGITVAVGNAHVTAGQRDACDRLLRAVGEVAWVDDEGLIDAVTAVSGSGPAYVFYLAESLAEAGVAAGLRARAGAAAGARNGGGGGRIAASLGARRGNAAPERHLAWRHHRRRPGGADGRDRGPARAHAQSRCGGGAALARACEIGRNR